MSTFAELGVPFALFEAPVDDASSFAGVSRCSLCDREETVCFHLDIGGAVMRECAACGGLSGLDASDAESVDCRSCGALIDFPVSDDEILTCHDCLRGGQAAITKDTELGMVSWEQALEGVTHGVPELAHPDFELVPRGEDGWIGARVPSRHLFELLRTPDYETIQGDRWLFCCRLPMVFQGSWARERFVSEAPDGDGKAYFEQIVEDAEAGLWEAELHEIVGVYVFRCAECSNRRAHWDVS